jgi:flagellar basal-body rod modification protein FlgD
VDVGNTPQTNALSGFSSSAGGVTQGGTAIGSDFETFIKMLTVQVKNQDPLNPIDSSDYAVQLATFSSVEQQVLTNTLLTGLGGQMGALSVAQLSGWVGMDARAMMPVFFESEPVTLTLRTDPLANTAQLVVLNNQGNEVQRLDIDPDGGDYLWSGLDDFGNPLPVGTYTMTTESFAAGELLSVGTVEVHGHIVEARNDNGQPTLIMDSGQQVNADQILGLLKAGGG